MTFKINSQDLTAQLDDKLYKFCSETSNVGCGLIAEHYYFSQEDLVKVCALDSELWRFVFVESIKSFPMWDASFKNLEIATQINGNQSKVFKIGKHDFMKAINLYDKAYSFLFEIQLAWEDYDDNDVVLTGYGLNEEDMHKMKIEDYISCLPNRIYDHVASYLVAQDIIQSQKEVVEIEEIEVEYIHLGAEAA